jgi:hypothetical protein
LSSASPLRHSLSSIARQVKEFLFISSNENGKDCEILKEAKAWGETEVKNY